MERPDTKAIREREQAATKGPWYSSDIFDNDGGGVVTNENGVVCGANTLRKNSDFIAHARTDIPALLEWIEHVEEANDKDASNFRKMSDELECRVAEQEAVIYGLKKELAMYRKADRDRADEGTIQTYHHQPIAEDCAPPDSACRSDERRMNDE